TMCQQDHRLCELCWAARLDIPVLPGSEVIVTGTVPDRGLHIKPLVVGEAIGDQFADAVIAASVPANVNHYRPCVFELFDDLVDRGPGLLQTPEAAKVKVADRIREPAVVENAI